MTEQYILSGDQGTSGTTALVVDRRGNGCGRGYAEITQCYPQPGWVEQDAEDIWQKTLQAIEGAKSQAGVEESQVAAIGIANQRETTILIDKATGNAICPAVVWQCRRTAARCEELRSQGLAEIVR